MFNTIKTFDKDMQCNMRCNGKITLEEADMDQSDLADEINNFIKKTKPKKL